MSKKLTIYTPIESNYANLEIIYNSLLRQTDQRFVWFIIDYNPIENANLYIEKFQTEEKLQIEYLHQPYKGRYLATKHAFENIKTDYIVGLDGNYIIVDDCIEILLRQWESIENNYPIAEIRGLSKTDSGALIGTSKYKYTSDFVDLTWHQMVLKNENYYEMIASWDRRKFLECVDFNHYQLFSDNIDELSTTLFWSALGRKYQTRYLNKPLKQKIESATPIRKPVNIFNNFVAAYYFLTENLEYFTYSPKYYSGVVFSLFRSAAKLKLSLNYLLKLNPSLKYKVILMTYYGPALVLGKNK